MDHVWEVVAGRPRRRTGDEHIDGPLLIVRALLPALLVPIIPGLHGLRVRVLDHEPRLGVRAGLLASAAETGPRGRRLRDHDLVTGREDPRAHHFRTHPHLPVDLVEGLKGSDGREA